MNIDLTDRQSALLRWIRSCEIALGPAVLLREAFRLMRAHPDLCELFNSDCVLISYEGAHVIFTLTPNSRLMLKLIGTAQFD